MLGNENAPLGLRAEGFFFYLFAYTRRQTTGPVETTGLSLGIYTAPLRTDLFTLPLYLFNFAEALYAPARVCPKIAVLSAALFIGYPSSSYPVDLGLRLPLPQPTLF